MKPITLYIETYDGTKNIPLNDEISIGRTDAATIVLADTGLSRLNTTFFRDEDLVFVVDENSTNGTFVNNERISGKPRQVFSGDKIKIGTETRIRVEIGQPATASRQPVAVETISERQAANSEQQTANKPAQPLSQTPNPKSGAPPMLIIISVGSTLLIAFFGIAAYLIASRYETSGTNPKGSIQTRIIASAAIPIRVVDPLGGEAPEGDVDLMEFWEANEAELDINKVQAVTGTNPTTGLNLAVSIDFVKQQIAKANEKRNAPTGLVSVNIPAELGGGRGIYKQIAKIKEMGFNINNLPHDFADLAKKRMKGDLIELPAATQFFYLDVGGSADESPFMQFDPNTRQKTPYAPGSEGYQALATLAANFDGQKYDLNDGANRRQMKIRLLRMFHPSALKILNELGSAYFQKFGRPLKVTSLTRSLEYQYELTKSNSNAFKGATPPHTTGCTFDLAYLQMTAEEQNFVMAKLAEFESRGSSDSLREVGVAPCIHTFVYPDGKPPQGVASLISLDFGLYNFDFLKSIYGENGN
ncbi:MAG: DUF5715 family protein [Pyrinomonadaceae bacterium]